MGYALGIFFILLLLAGLPIGLALGLGSLLSIELYSTVPLEIMVQRLISGIRSFPLLAIPLYIIAGALMNASGITQRLVDFAYAILGGIRGGLAHVSILTTAIFGGISGSQVADTASVGRLMIPQMVSRGYSRPYAVSLMATAGAIFVTIPPGISLILYGVLAQVSISEMFFWGLIVGIGCVLSMLAMAFVLALILGQPKEKWLPFRQILTATRRAIWALLIPVVVLGGIRIGAFTPTEGGAVAVLLALVIGFFIHRQLTFKAVVRSLAESSVLVGVIMLVIAAAQMYSWALISGQVPQALTSAILGVSPDPLIVLLLINVVALLMGTVMEGNSALIVLVPILLPIGTALGIDPIHLGLILVFNLGIGLLTPPVGMCMLVAAKIGKIEVSRTISAMVPWFCLSLVLLMAVTYLPIMFGWV